MIKHIRYINIAIVVRENTCNCNVHIYLNNIQPIVSNSCRFSAGSIRRTCNNSDQLFFYNTIILLSLLAYVYHTRLLHRTANMSRRTCVVVKQTQSNQPTHDYCKWHMDVQTNSIRLTGLFYQASFVL